MISGKGKALLNNAITLDFKKIIKASESGDTILSSVST